ncbi:MAG: DNA mismatch repair endonuclease MutL [Chloroflexaceae bacterium]|nr:DNA mismatch repair endonuclease MutL [Chloroflexaceae bacterium]
MSGLIQRLAQDVINLIAAGEVIDSLAAVVRELSENALDAGATRIVVCLWPQVWRVQVVDNGRGMTLADLRFCAEAHSTSKIHTCQDLSQITSLGFRGEALHSIAQLADLEICSRSEAAAAGWCLRYHNGTPQPEAVAAIAPGTIVTVSNLFGNRLGRQRCLSASSQIKAVQQEIFQLALCHPRVTWQVQQNDKPWFALAPGAKAEEILAQILKSIHSSDLHSAQVSLGLPPEGPETSTGNTPTGQGHLEVVLGLPDRCHRRRPDWVRVAVNGRRVKLVPLEQAIVAAFSRTLPRDRYPVCFVHLRVCPSFVDWNRHPSKAEIYLQELDYWREQVAKTIESTLILGPANLPTALENRRVGQLLKASEEKGRYQIEPIEPKSCVSRRKAVDVLALQALAQVRNTYILAEHPGGLWLIEQHIAHERVLYEQLQDDWQLIPLPTAIALKRLSTKQLEQLARLGIEIEPFGEDLWVARNAPELLQQREDCAEALVELSLGGDLQEAQVATACRSAIRNGTPLQLGEMQALLDRWKFTRNPHTCPHGRPIYLSLEETSLARFFRRHWVIGKSHGI